MLRPEAFDRWLEEEAPSKPKLRWLLRMERGKDALVAAVATLILFLVFLVRVISEASAKDRPPSTILEQKEQPARDTARGSQVAHEQRSDIGPQIEPDSSAQNEAPPKREEVVATRPALDAERLLGDFQRQRERRDRDLSGELSRLNAMEAVVFWIMIVAGVITILLVVSEQYLSFWKKSLLASSLSWWV